MKNEKKLDLYPRKCSATGEGMDSGYVVDDGMYYFKYECDLLNFLKSEYDFGDMTSSYDSDLLLEISYEKGIHYWTEWELLDDDENYLADGTLVPVDKPNDIEDVSLWSNQELAYYLGTSVDEIKGSRTDYINHAIELMSIDSSGE